MQLGDASSVFLRVNGQKGSGLVNVTLVGHGSEHVNTLEWGLSELFEIGLWSDVFSLRFLLSKTHSYQAGNWTSPCETNKHTTFQLLALILCR